MGLEVILLLLRILSGGLLLAFMGALFWMLWRDFRMANAHHALPPVQRGRLVVVHTELEMSNGKGAYSLTPVTSIGRATSNTICLEDTFTSNEHALISFRAGQWWLEDRQSSNGTRLNGYRVEESVVLSAGDLIGVGRVEFRLELE
jgi:FHA domain